MGEPMFFLPDGRGENDAAPALLFVDGAPEAYLLLTTGQDLIVLSCDMTPEDVCAEVVAGNGSDSNVPIYRWAAEWGPGRVFLFASETGTWGRLYICRIQTHRGWLVTPMPEVSVVEAAVEYPKAMAVLLQLAALRWAEWKQTLEELGGMVPEVEILLCDAQGDLS